MTTAIEIAPVVLAIVLLGCASGFDLAYRRLPNWLPAALAVDGIVGRIVSGTLPAGLIAGACVFAACALLWRWGVMGGGDVKLFGAAAVATPATGSLVLGTAFAGGLLALAYIILRRVVPKPAVQRPRRLLSRFARVELRRIHGGVSLPYCCAIAMGAVVAFTGL